MQYRFDDQRRYDFGENCPFHVGKCYEEVRVACDANRHIDVQRRRQSNEWDCPDARAGRESFCERDAGRPSLEANKTAIWWWVGALELDT